MKSIAMLIGIIAMLLFGAIDLAAQSTEEEDIPVNTENDIDPVQVRYWTDRTAMFPGDTITYFVEIHCAADADILLDDLDASQLSLTGLEVVSSDQTRTESDGKLVYHVSYSLTTFDLDPPSLQINPLIIRYFVRGSATSTNIPAGEVVIPAIPLSLRSTLAAPPMQSRLRDSVASVIVPAGISHALSTGLLLILISAVPVVLWLLSLMRERARMAQQQQQLHTIIKTDEGVLVKLRNISASNVSERRQGFDQLDRLVRDLLGQSGGINPNALTAAEIAAGPAYLKLTVPREHLAAVVGDCEQARYARPEQLPTVERFEAGIDLVRRLLIAH